MRVQQTNKRVKAATLRFLNRSWLRSIRAPYSRQSPRAKLRSDSGQIVLEYILLLVISVSVATYLTKKLVGKDPEDAGIVTSAWAQINSAIGADIIE